MHVRTLIAEESIVYLLPPPFLEPLKLVILWGWALGHFLNTGVTRAPPLLTGVHHHLQLLPGLALARVLAPGCGVSSARALAVFLGYGDWGIASLGVQQGADFGVRRGLESK